MCLYTHATETLTAKKDITVFKVINKNDKARYMPFQYRPNTLYRLRKALQFDKCNASLSTIDEGFHAYYGFTSINLHEFLHMVDRMMLKIVEFTIPKGAKYVFDKDMCELLPDQVT